MNMTTNIPFLFTPLLTKLLFLLMSITFSSKSQMMINAANISNNDTACRGSNALKYAKCLMKITFPKNSCDEVSTEIHARIQGEKEWIDPHNQGTYELDHKELSSDKNLIYGSRRTGDGKYTDKFGFVLEPYISPTSKNHNGCEVEACSESQVFSILDFSTNYCNLHSLYCNSEKGCTVVHQDLINYKEDYVNCWQNDVEKCFPARVSNAS
mmetsp:Transcript_14167/g.20231  ORF Transcript_14167/g.20231 Transcript_14167/m.20231 type:complete len:211 (+) Transcript_14167:95-727(+)